MNQNMKMILGIVVLVIGGVFVWRLLQQPSDVELNTESTENITDMPPITSESPNVLGTMWVAQSVNDAELVENTTITVQMNEDGTISGSDGCNTFAGSYTMEGTNLTIDPALASTGMACEENVMTQADVFTQTLLATTSYTLGDGVLVLSQEGVDGLRFIGQSNSLSKTTWEVTGYNNGNQAVVSGIAGTNMTLTFGDDGTVSGSASCNTFSGQYSLNGEEISISSVVSSMRECIEPEGAMEQEQAFLTALESAATWQILGDQLSLRTAEDELAVMAVISM